ncbi:MAG TPA: sensor histidine kinase [Stenomitos sp.]
MPDTEELCPDPTCEHRRGVEDRRRQLLKRLIALQEEERRQVARELHEGAGQMLTSLLFGLKMLDGALSLEEVKRFLPELKNQTWEALETMRQISVNLRPPLLEDLGLVSTLRSYARDFGARHQMDVFFSLHGEERRLGQMSEVTVFRIVQEALVNAGKYSQATQVALAMTFTTDHLQVKIEDNGVGMDTAQLARSGNAVGIIGMQERADFVGGTCTIESSPGRGVNVILTVPLVEPAAST